MGLEVAQAEGLRRLNTTMTSSLADNEDSLTAALRSEVWRSLEPVRQLPQLLAAASALPGMTEVGAKEQLT